MSKYSFDMTCVTCPYATDLSNFCQSQLFTILFFFFKQQNVIDIYKNASVESFFLHVANSITTINNTVLKSDHLRFNV